MGAKTWMLVYSSGRPDVMLKSGPKLDRQASEALAKRLFPTETLVALADGNLLDTAPGKKELVIGCFKGLAIVAAREFALDCPSTLPRHFVDAFPGSHVYLHVMHSVVDWFALALWEGGRLQRALSVSPDNGVIEDIGSRRSFELPFWAGERPAGDPDQPDDTYPLAFHPLEFGEAALLDLFGYQLEGMTDEGDVEPESIPLLRFRRA